MISSKNKSPKNKKQMREEMFKSRPVTDQERKIMITEWDSKVIMGSEGLMFTSEVVDGIQFEVEEKNIENSPKKA
jgi:hypothetical protein